MASGNPLASWLAFNIEGPIANFASQEEIVVVSADSDEAVIHVLDFDPATNEHGDFYGVMPDHYAGGGVTALIAFFAAVASGNVKWDLTFKRLQDDTVVITTAAFGAAPAGNTATKAVGSVANEIVFAVITITDGADLDSIAKNEPFGLRLTRDAADAGDTLDSNDARLFALYLQET